MNNENYDIVVIGSGPGGYTTAVRASQLGFKVACIENKELGGTCLNWGCIPTKALLKSAEVYTEIKKAKEYGINVDKYDIDFSSIIDRSRKIAKKQEKGIEYLFKKNKITTIKGKAEFLDKNTLKIINNNEEINIEAKKIIIATGAIPKSLPNIKIDHEYIIDSKDAMSLSKKPESMIIIGAGAIGIEFGYFYSQIGTKVTIIEALDNLLPNEDEEISKNLEREFRKQKIKFYTKSFLKNITIENDQANIVFENSKGKIEELKSSKVLMAVGVTGNYKSLNIERIELETDRGFIKVNKSNYQTNIDNIYAIGDIIGPPLLAHVASHEGISCIEKIANEKDPTNINYDLIPGCTYCKPQVASIGITEKQAKDKNMDIRIGKYSFMANGKASAIGDNSGMIKVIINNENNQVIGCHIIGAEATELLTEMGLALNKKCTTNDIIHTIHAHPTLSEGLMEAVANADNKSINV